MESRKKQNKVVAENIFRQWMDVMYVSMLEISGNGVYKYDSKLMSDSLAEMAKEDNEENVDA